MQWTWDNKPVTIIKVGIFLTQIEYRDLFRDLHTMLGGRRFHVRTMELELQNGRDL